MNIDKGNQSRAGESALALGDVAHPEVVGSEYRIKTLDNANRPLTVQTDSEGRLWLLVGTDSGFSKALPLCTLPGYPSRCPPSRRVQRHAASLVNSARLQGNLPAKSSQFGTALAHHRI